MQSTTEPRQTPIPRIDSPAIYRIRVAGKVDPDSVRQSTSLSISYSQHSESETETVMVGRFQDQAALAGLLMALYDMRRVVISMDCLGAD